MEMITVVWPCRRNIRKKNSEKSLKEMYGITQKKMVLSDTGVHQEERKEMIRNKIIKACGSEATETVSCSFTELKTW